MDRHVFHDRRSAGALLGVEVAKAKVGSPVVLGLPRGGVPVAAGVAEAIDAPLDVIVVRKLGVPHQPELAMGAIGENGVVIVNRDVVRGSRTSEQELAAVEARERAELDRRLGYLRSVRPHESLLDRPAVIVDDGIATGATIRAAIQVARAYGASDVTVATPVAPPDVVEMLGSEADRVVCLTQPEPFGSVGRWYRNFEAVTDAEVLQAMSAAAGRSTDGDAS
jgi:putative phosphoribosyl transferase